jgi:uncharacterized radical SAM superfamily Fe-S cluster-containing enzyme
MSRILKETKSLCPECLAVIDARILEDQGKVKIVKICSQHGTFEDTYWSDYKQYARFEKYEWIGDGISNPRTKTEKECPYDCGICPEHKSQTVLAIVDVTNRCNLRCPVCFANAAAAGYTYEPTREQIYEMLRNLRRNSPFAPVALQFSGGEPTIREDLPELVEKAKELGFEHVEVNTNGVKISQSVSYIQELMKKGVDTFYLQFDGLTDDVYKKTRGVPLLDVKMKAIENARKAGLDSMVLVPTVVKGINDQMIGDIIHFAAKNYDVVRGVNFQPVSICGRIDKSKLSEMRITISDVLRLAEEQTEGELKASDFYPVPVVVPIAKAVGALKGRRYSEFTAHQHCGAATFILVDNGKFTPITRYVNVDKFMDSMKKVYELASKGKKTQARIHLAAATRHIKFGVLKDLMGSMLTTSSYESLGKLMRKMIMISSMHFMDPYNFDLQRIQRCCIHYAVPDGRIIPFCTMNSIHRPEIEKKFAVAS